MSASAVNRVPVSADNPSIIRLESLCTDCGHCLATCAEMIGPARKWLQGEEFSCMNCGQCVATCPEGALRIKPQIDAVKDAAKDPRKIVVFSTAPSVRVGIGDAFGYPKGAFLEGELVSALRALGGDYVFDVTFSADLTILEEGTEFLKRLLDKDSVLPQFTSCCPAWVKYVETFHPDMIPNLSTAKSPISMQGATIKTYLAAKRNLDPKDIVSVAIAPCTAKKFEITREELSSAGKELGISGLMDNDYVLTTQEVAQWLKDEGIDLKSLPASEYDELLGRGSGAGVIFGNTGGVMEAALRMAYSALTGETPDALLLRYDPVRGLDSFKKAEVTVGGQKIRVAVVFGTQTLEQYLPELMKEYHFVEVMTCPGGCISGAGQPGTGVVPVQDDLRTARIDSLYRADTRADIKMSMDNPDVQMAYREFYGKPLGEISEKLLHTTYHSRQS